MNDTVLKNSILFKGIPVNELREDLAAASHHILCYEKGEIIFHLMEPAARVGILLEGRVEVQKSFSNGSQVNVSLRGPGEMIGPAAMFSKTPYYPCDVVSLEPVTVMMFRREELLSLMQRDIRILENFVTEVSSAAYMLQQRLELMSYSGIAQKAACWLLMRSRQTGSETVRIPGSISKWALQLNVSRPSLHRELKRLEQQGMISFSSSEITILNAQALQDVLGH